MRVRCPGVNYSKSLQSATLSYVQRSDGDQIPMPALRQQ